MLGIVIFINIIILIKNNRDTIVVACYIPICKLLIITVLKNDRE